MKEITTWEINKMNMQQKIVNARLEEQEQNELVGKLVKVEAIVVELCKRMAIDNSNKHQQQQAFMAQIIATQ